MDRKELYRTAVLPQFRTSWAILALLAVGVLTFSASRAYSSEETQPEAKPKTQVEAQATAEESPGFFHRVFGTYAAAFESVQLKVNELRHLDEENRKLRLENAHLRATVETMNFEKNAAEARAKTTEYEGKLHAETQSSTGRTLASIVYQIPKNLPTKELYALGISYFRSRDDEKSAVILSSLVGMDDDERYKTPSNLMMTGMAWYRVEHYAKAELYFDQVLEISQKNQEQPEFATLSREALLWKGLIAEKTGQHAKSQTWLKSVLDRAPSSVEAAMVNQSKPGIKTPRAQDAPHETHAANQE